MSLSLDNVSAYYEDRCVLTAISLTFASPGLTGIIGPNGAGKTTLLKSIAGLTARAGSISLDTESLDARPAAETAKTVAWCAQSSFPAWPVTVDDVIRLGRLPHRNDPDKITRDKRAVDTVIDRMALSQILNRRIDTLSGGERSRALLARALCTEARILLVDEPTADLDPYQELRTMEVLREEAERGIHVLAVLHNLSLAARFCDDIVVLHNGRLRAHGTPAEVLDQALLSDVYAVNAIIEDYSDELLVIPWRRLDQSER